jgi:hypothetical protein
VPGPCEDAQSFETVAEAPARVEWNAIPAQTTIAWQPAFGDTALYLAGVATQLQAGDAILIVGEERRTAPGSERWDIRVITAVEPDNAAQRTRVRWANGLGSAMPFVNPAGVGASVYVFRQRAALFGHNAPDPRLMRTSGTALADLIEGSGANRTWKASIFSIQGSQIDLDTAYPKIVAGSWIALVSNEASAHPSGLQGYVELYNAMTVSYPSRTDFGLSGKVTRIVPDTDENLDEFRNRIRQNLVLAQSEALAVAEVPIAYPLYGQTLPLARIVEGLKPEQVIALSGKRARIRIRRGQPDIAFELATGETATLHEGDSLALAAHPERKHGLAWLVLTPVAFGALVAKPGTATLRLTLIDRDGAQGTCIVPAAAIEHAAAEDADESVSEIAFVSALADAVMHDRDRTTLALSAPLAFCYDRTTLRVNANVAAATHGETVNEILGSGDARVPNARYPLKQGPLTYVSAATPSGRASTLELRANDIEWQEVPSLYARTPTERVYETKIDDAGRTTVQFGDGVEGARPPSGDHNIRAKYRKYLGLGGNVAAGRITNLLSRPLGVTAASNPVAAIGGEDAETTDKARGNAPLTVLTLERAVSIRDYRDFARAFAGIAKAHALWVPAGPGRGVFVTAAGENGAAVVESSHTYRNLLDALRAYGDALVPLRLVNYRDARFRTRIALKVAADHDASIVLPAVEARLREAFGFDARDFGRGASVDEVSAIAQAVAGVEAVHIAELHRLDEPLPLLAPRLFTKLPLASLDAVPEAAEILTLDPGPLTLELLP